MSTVRVLVKGLGQGRATAVKGAYGNFDILCFLGGHVAHIFQFFFTIPQIFATTSVPSRTRRVIYAAYTCPCASGGADGCFAIRCCARYMSVFLLFPRLQACSSAA